MNHFDAKRSKGTQLFKPEEIAQAENSNELQIPNFPLQIIKPQGTTQPITKLYARWFKFNQKKPPQKCIAHYKSKFIVILRLNKEGGLFIPPVMNFQDAETSDALNIQQDVGSTGILFTSLNNIGSCIIFWSKKLSRGVTTLFVV